MASAQGHSVDDYLEAIHALAASGDGAEGAPIAARVADRLEVSRAAAGEMVKRLVGEGLVEREGRGRLSLTEAGRARAASAVRRRRILERFVTDVLAYPPEESHARAGELVAAFSPEMVERLHRRLGEPELCPHGRPISPCA